MTKKRISLLLALCLLLTLLPLPVVAVDGTKEAAANVSTDYVVISEVKAGETALTCADSAASPYVFGSDATVVEAAESKVNISFKVAATDGNKVYAVTRDTGSPTLGADGSVSEQVTITNTDTDAKQSLTYKIKAGENQDKAVETSITLKFTVKAATVAVTGVTLDQSSIALVVGGETKTLTATVAPSNATTKTVSWSSSDENVATVANGVVTAVGAGDATITVTTDDGSKTAKCTVTVTAKPVAVTGVTLSQSTLTVQTNKTATLTATVAPDNATNKAVTWSSSNTEYATVADTGVVTGVKAGKATITVTTTDGSHTATCEVTVTDTAVAVTGVTLNKKSLTLDAGASESLTATVEPAGVSQTVTWESDNPDAAIVDGTGKVTAVAPGTANITATAEADTSKKAACAVTVQSAPTPAAKEYTIKFAAGQGATGEIADVTLPKAETGATTYKLPTGEAITFTAPEGEAFDKWTVSAEGVSISEDGTTLTIAATVDTANPITVTATWKLLNASVAAPEVDTGDLEDAGLSAEEIEAVTESASSIKTETADGTDPLAEALTEQKAEVEALVKSVNVAEKTAEIEQLKGLSGISVSSAEDVSPVVVTYMEIKVTEYKPADSKLTMEIEPQMMVVLTSKTIAADGTTIKTSGDDQNAVKLEDTKKPVEIKKSVVIKVTLPGSFVENAGEKDIFVGHTTKAGRYEYKGRRSGNNFSFTNPHGFSPFDFTTDPTSGAWIGDVGYKDLSSALDEVKDGETITVTNADTTTGSTARTDLAGKSFTILKSDSSAWSGSVTINGTKYTPDSTGKITVTKPGDSGNSGGGGGGGGGSSKPSVKPGDKPATPGTTTPSGGVAGFNDVATGAWYADSVKFVVDKGLFGGVGNGRFAPNDNMTRAMMWTVLARYKGVNTNTGSNWYEAARAWAIEQNISDGTMADGNVTREQFVTMLWRLSGEPTVDNAASFTDSGKVSGYAKTAVDWAVAQGIVNGYSDGTFKPQGSATRAEVAKMLTVFVQSEETA